MMNIKLCAFDTEASSVNDYRGIYSVLYHWELLILDVDYKIIDKDNIDRCTTRIRGREVKSLYIELDKMLSDRYVYRIAVHNLSYDYMFLRKWIKDLDFEVNICARNTTRLLSVKVGNKWNPKIVFFDTLAIFGYSLSRLGCNLGYEKSKIDYTESLSPKSVLSDGNMYYNDRDVDILMLGICKSLLTRYGVSLEDLGIKVLTKTGIVRLQDKIDPNVGMLETKTSNGKTYTLYELDRMQAYRHKLDERDYKSWRSYSDTMTSDIKGCYSGGINLSNVHCLGKLLHNVKSYDLRSAYPGIMIEYKIPTNPIAIDNPRDYNYLLERHMPDVCHVLSLETGFWKGLLKFTNISIDTDWYEYVGDTTISESIVAQYDNNEGLVYCNGIFFHADVLYITCINSMFYEFCLQYQWEKVEFIELTVYLGNERISDYTCLRTVKRYNEKYYCKNYNEINLKMMYDKNYISEDEREALKGDFTDEWFDDFVLMHKANLNSLYGIMVTDQYKTDYTFDDHCLLIENGVCDITRNNIVFREAGVLVSMFNRYKMAYAIRLLVDKGVHVIYSDTDSIKVATDLDVKNVFVDLEASIRELNYSTLMYLQEKYGIDDECGLSDIGIFDYDGSYDDFVTMGHKKYAVGNGKKWSYRISGYKISSVDDVSKHLVDNGLYELAPFIIMGYDNRYDSSVKVMTVNTCIDDLWTDVEYCANDKSGCDESKHIYKGGTCTGYVIMYSGKIMNNTEMSRLNMQRKNKCISNNPGIEECFDLDIALHDGVYEIGDRGSVTMDWPDFKKKVL